METGCGPSDGCDSPVDGRHPAPWLVYRKSWSSSYSPSSGLGLQGGALSDTRGCPPFSRCESCSVNHGLSSVLTAMWWWLPKQFRESCFHKSCLHGAGVLFTGLRQVKDVRIHVFRDRRKREMFWGVVWYTQRWEWIQESSFKVKSRSVPPCDSHPPTLPPSRTGYGLFLPHSKVVQVPRILSVILSRACVGSNFSS